VGNVRSLRETKNIQRSMQFVSMNILRAYHWQVCIQEHDNAFEGPSTSTAGFKVWDNE
jgi:hypothetical protein